jgi:hypothetical protein
MPQRHHDRASRQVLFRVSWALSDRIDDYCARRKIAKAIWLRALIERALKEPVPPPPPSPFALVPAPDPAPDFPPLPLPFSIAVSPSTPIIVPESLRRPDQDGRFVP